MTARKERVTTDRKPTTISSFELAVTKIMQETGRSRDEAITGLVFIQDMAAKARTGERCGTTGTHHLTDEEMDTVGYAVMDSIMEHNEAATPDSAHAAVQAHILGPNEFALTHGNPTGEREDCVVTVDVGFIS